jgi:hypothetical protein
MTRKSTIVWIVSAVVVVGVGVAIAVPSLANSHGKVTSAVTPVASPSADGPTAVASSPSAGATPSASVAPADPASPSASSSASASPTSKPVVTVKNVTPHLTYYDWTSSTSTLEVGGNVPGMVDAGGSCVVTATHGSVTVSQAFPASAQASSTECGTMRLTSPKLTAGTWNLTIGYRSPRATGTSASTEVTL